MDQGLLFQKERAAVAQINRSVLTKGTPRCRVKRIILSSGDSEKRYLLCKTEERIQRIMDEENL